MNATTTLEAIVAEHTTTVAMVEAAPATTPVIIPVAVAFPHRMATIEALVTLSDTDPDAVKAELSRRMANRASKGKKIFPSMITLAAKLNVPVIGTVWAKPVSKTAATA